MAKRWKKFVWRFSKFAILIAVAVFFIGGVALLVWVPTLSIPDFQSFEDRKIIQSTKIYDSTGEILLYDVHQNISRTVIPFGEIPRHIKNATVAIEDSEFYQHHGISFEGIARAFLMNLSQGKIKGQGGSTITQQLVKNSLLTSEKSITRKIKEIILSLKIEKIFTKEEILVFYLNEIPYGGSNYGIETASRFFFGKNAKNLTLAEAAYLAALPQAPTYYSPYGNHRDGLDQRKDLILDRMFKLGFISQEEFNAAKKETVNFVPRSEQNIKAPHFVMFIKGYLEEKYGKDAVEEDGLKVISTLNWKLQQTAEKIVAQYAKDNEGKFNAKNAGLIAIDPKTGKILAMVGSRDYFDVQNEGNFNVTLAQRQPGSSFKPFVYATAFKKGYASETTVFDLQTEFNSSCNPDGTPKQGTQKEECYMPENYDSVFRGPVTLRNALAQSINVPSVKVLYLADINDSIETAKSMGITTLADSSRYGLTLVLGGGEVTLLEMTGAYSVFANDGAKNPVTGILRIEDGKGNIIEQFLSQPTQVLEPNISRLISNILSDNEARTPAFGAQSYLYFPERNVAVKTGTTNNYRDAWVIGYAPNLAVGVWCGNNDNSPMEKKVAGFIAAPMWNAFFREALMGLAKEDFIKPKPAADGIKPVLAGEWKGGITYLINSATKKRATESTPKELVQEKVLTQVHSILYWVNKDNPLGPIPENPGLDSQFSLWEKPVRDWVLRQGIKEETLLDIPQELDR
ncbi:MAG: PBP1A family penicillin-binding protein [Candidatus Tagabacteria bacterium]